jgi:hypothetical protein
MTDALRENERLDAASIRIERVADRARRGERQDAVTIVQPGSVQQRISWALERPLSAPESFDIGGRPLVSSDRRN